MCVRRFSLLLAADGISGSRKASLLLPSHYKEGTSLLLGGDESSDSPHGLKMPHQQEEGGVSHYYK